MVVTIIFSLTCELFGHGNTEEFSQSLVTEMILEACFQLKVK